MKTAKRKATKARSRGKVKGKTKKSAATKKAAPRKAVSRRTASKTARGGAKPKAARSTKSVAKAAAGSVASLAASVLSRRAKKVAAKAEGATAGRAVHKTAPSTRSSPPASKRPAKPAAARSSRSSGTPHKGTRQLLRVARAPQFNYMKAPGADSGFDVGDAVEVLCDHEQDGERVRDWVKGTVVQVDNKLVAVQFRSNVFLTDGWMVPDRILWYSVTSDQIRATGVGKKPSRAAIPEY
jgi:hypothetical protein